MILKEKGISREKSVQGSRKKRFSRETFHKLMRLRKALFFLDPFSLPLARDSFGREKLNRFDKPKLKPCCLFYDQLRNEHIEKDLYKSEGCQARAVCPVCGTSYWRDKGRQAKSLFQAQRDKLILAGFDVQQWLLDFEFTVPVILSRLIDGMSIAYKRKYLNELTRASYKVLSLILGSDFGGGLVVHFWRSKSPLYPHYHFHLIVSPYDSRGQPILEEPFLSLEKLEFIRDSWREEVTKIFGIGFKQSFNVHYQYIEENKKVSSESCINRYNHRFNYAFRHWTEDLLKYKVSLMKRPVERATKRAKDLQKITKIRWFGYMCPVKRKKAGFDSVRYRSKITLCPLCSKQYDTEKVLDSLIFCGEQTLVCVCGQRIERKDMGKSEGWKKTGKRFMLRGFRDEGVILVDVATGQKKIVPYEDIDFFPCKGAKKRFVCRSP